MIKGVEYVVFPALTGSYQASTTPLPPDTDGIDGEPSRVDEALTVRQTCEVGRRVLLAVPGHGDRGAAIGEGRVADLRAVASCSKKRRPVKADVGHLNGGAARTLGVSGVQKCRVGRKGVTSGKKPQVLARKDFSDAKIRDAGVGDLVGHC